MSAEDHNPVQIYLNGLNARNNRTSREALDLLAERIWKNGSKKAPYDGKSAPWWKLTDKDVIRIREQLATGEWVSQTTGEPFASTEVNRFLTSLRGVLRECWRLQLMPASIYLDAAAKLKTVSPRVR